MNNIYEKPLAEVVDFKLNENIMDAGMSYEEGVGGGGPDDEVQ